MPPSYSLSPSPDAGRLAGEVLADLLARHPALAPLRDGIWRAYEMLAGVYGRDGKVLVAGNGGSAADAEHVVGELMKGFMRPRPLPRAERDALDAALREWLPDGGARFQRALPALCLGAQSALATAVANDLGPDLVFAQQVAGYGRPGDLLWVFSTSGDSRNLLCAVAAAKARGLATLAFAGRDGGRLRTLADLSLIAPGANTPEIQEYHLPLYHALCRMVELHFFA